MSNEYEFNYEGKVEDTAPIEISQKTPSQDIIVLDKVEKNLATIFAPNGSEELLREIKDRVESVVLDVSTKKAASK